MKCQRNDDEKRDASYFIFQKEQVMKEQTNDRVELAPSIERNKEVLGQI